MALTPSAKKKLGVLGLALAALAIDRGLIFSGGSDASAQAAPNANPQQSTPDVNKQSGPSAQAIEVAEALDSLRDIIEFRDIERDAFRLPESLQPQVEEPPIPSQAGLNNQPIEVASDAPRPDLPSFEVTSIIASSTSNPMAVINGTPIRVGQTRDGMTLISVSARAATIVYMDQTIELRLDDIR